MIDEKVKIAQSTIYLSTEDVKMKADIQKVAGRFSNSEIYRRGLLWLMDKYVVKSQINNATPSVENSQ